MFSRLSDPSGCVTPQILETISTKLNKAMLLMAKSQHKGGNPFLFALTAAKQHQLANALPDFHLKNFNSCATTGKVFYWHPGFIDNLAPKDIVTVINHESTHILLNHMQRAEGKNLVVWNIAVDFIVNAIMEHDHRVLGNGGSPWRVPVFGSNITLHRLLNHLDGKNLIKEKLCIYTDPSLYKMTPEHIYDLIMEKWPEDPKQSKDMADSLGLMDDHVPCEIGKDDILDEVIQATEQAKMREGSLPGHIEDMLQSLSNPVINFLDMIRFALFNRTRSDGMRNDWKRPRRRGLALGQYLPRRYTYKTSWICLLDTSGSMSNSDISFGVSQLQSLGDSKGIIVPCDAAVHWDDAIEVSSASDIAKAKAIGRGGTVFNEFFELFVKKFGEEFDVVIIITDGMCGRISPSLAPRCPTIWAITSNHSFKPSFGKSVRLR